MTKVLIAAGGSGGHIFPAIALGRSLEAAQDGVELMYVGSDKALDKRIFEKEGMRYAVLSTNKLPYRISPGMIVVFFKLVVDVFRSLSLMMSYRPDVVVGFGGYVSFPVLFVARALGIPKIVHEQNVVPGRANKLLFRYADRIALSFKETEKILGDDARKAVRTGNPIRTEISGGDRSHGVGRFGLDINKFTMLVIGGSQGASVLNKTFIDAMASMDRRTRSKLQVIHITGVKDYEWALGSYVALEMEHRVHSFVDRIEEAYSAADLVITRSGASALFELAFLRKPMILIPYPFAKSHQLENALVFSSQGAAIVIEEKSLTAVNLGEVVTALIGDAPRVRSLSDAAARLAVPDAAERLAHEVINMKRK